MMTNYLGDISIDLTEIRHGIAESITQRVELETIEDFIGRYEESKIRRATLKAARGKAMEEKKKCHRFIDTKEAGKKEGKKARQG
jgi:hypothetical protein